MNPDSVVEAWEHAENACYGFLREALGATHNADSFIAELPKDFVYNSRRGMWLFAIGDEPGDAPLDAEFNVRHPGGMGTNPLWQMPARLQGVWTERSAAILAAGVMRAVLPIPENSIDGIFRFNRRTEPNIVRTTILRKADQDKGGIMRVWRMQQPMVVTFKKAPVAG